MPTHDEAEQSKAPSAGYRSSAPASEPSDTEPVAAPTEHSQTDHAPSTPTQPHQPPAHASSGQSPPHSWTGPTSHTPRHDDPPVHRQRLPVILIRPRTTKPHLLQRLQRISPSP